MAPREICRIFDCDVVAPKTTEPIDFVEQTGPSGGLHKEALALCDVHTAELARKELDFGRITDERRFAETEWARRCKDCGLVGESRHASKGLAELKAYSGYEAPLEHRAPRCRRCGSLEIEAVEVAVRPDTGGRSSPA